MDRIREQRVIIREIGRIFLMGSTQVAILKRENTVLISPANKGLKKRKVGVCPKKFFWRIGGITHRGGGRYLPQRDRRGVYFKKKS